MRRFSSGLRRTVLILKWTVIKHDPYQIKDVHDLSRSVFREGTSSTQWHRSIIVITLPITASCGPWSTNGSEI